MALKVGDAAPDFKVACSTGDTQGEFQLSAHRGKNVVILFYPLDFTPVCESELAAFQEEIDKFRNANTEVVANSAESVFPWRLIVGLTQKSRRLMACFLPRGIRFPL